MCKFTLNSLAAYQTVANTDDNLLLTRNAIFLRSYWYMGQSSYRSIHQSFGALRTSVSSLLTKEIQEKRQCTTVLAITYLLQENPTIQDLIRLIIYLIFILSATFTAQLPSFHKDCPSEALATIMAFLTLAVHFTVCMLEINF